MDKPLILCVVGTRPEAIKMAPVVLELRKFSDLVQTKLISTGQHDQILLAALGTFSLVPDQDLGIMRHGQGLAGVTSRALVGLDQVIEQEQPSFIIGQGDTTTTLATAMAAFYRSVPFAHVEAGLRTSTILNPFPEEFNRRVAGLVTRLHFPPTAWARENLLREHVDPDSIFVTGNTGIDAVLQVAGLDGTEWFPEHRGRVVLLTTHRRENWGDPQRHIAAAARKLVEEFADLLLVVPMHPNPNVRALLSEVLGENARIRLIEPPEYAKFVKLLQRSHLILTDSGGVQEEAPAFGRPVLVLRDTTERPEGVHSGTARLVGTSYDVILEAASELLSNGLKYSEMAQAVSPYGDGLAAQRVRYHVLRSLELISAEVQPWQ